MNAPIATRSFEKLLFAVVMVAGVSAAQAAHAQTETPEFREREAKRAYAHKEFDRARRLYEELYASDPKPKYLWNLAIVENQSGAFVDALHHFKTYLKSSDASDKDRDDARAYLHELAAKTGHIAVEAPTGTHLVVDGVDNGMETPLDEPLDVRPGQHEIEGRRDGKSKTVAVRAGAGQLVTARLVFDAPAPLAEVLPPAPAVATARAPIAPPPEHREVRTSHGPAKIVTVATIGAAALASFGAGIGFAIAKANAEERLDALRASSGPSACSHEAQPESCTKMNDEVDAIHRNTTFANVFLGAGIGLVLVGGVAWLVWPKTSPSDTPRARVLQIAPVLTPHAAGLTSTVGF
ncbi:tetratricopeptide repeat protein [Pendulispora albinea]|uniref:PEGA domain-containing protein n=1 Tax=Pendulispora albinea TaxID=2741071 RepID=A0ABZ2M6W7_9BACT